MDHHKASKVVIITEKIIVEKVAKLIENAGARGYTITPAGGKGSRGVRSTNRANVVDELGNVKIEIITGSKDAANRIADEVTEQFFDNYSGITYLEEVEILRPDKF